MLKYYKDKFKDYFLKTIIVLSQSLEIWLSGKEIREKSIGIPEAQSIRSR